MKKRNILLSLVVLFVFSINSVSALEVSDSWTEYQKGTASIEVDKFLEFEEKLAIRVNDLNKLNLDRVYRYSIEVTDDEEMDDYLEVSNDMSFDNVEEALEWASNNEPEKEGWSFLENIIKDFKLDKIFNLTRFETEKEANDAIVEFENSVDEESTDITVTEIRDEAGDVVETVINDYKFDTFDDAYNASLKLIESNRDYIVTVKVVEEDPEYVITEEITLSTTIFDSKDEVVEYITSLENVGYEVIYEIKEVNELSTLEETYEEKINAESALAEFLKLYPETTISNIEEIRDEAGDVTETITNDYKFDSEEEATNKANSLKENTKYYVVSVEVVNGTPEYVETKTEEFEVAFTTESEAMEYITSLENAGLEVEYNIEEVNELSTLDEVYETKEEAENVLEEFLKLYPETKVSNITEVRDEEDDEEVKVENTSKYYTFEDAYNASLKLIENNHDYIVDVNVYSGDPELVSTDTLTLEMVFDTREEAVSQINKLIADGYTVESTIEEVTEISTLNKTYDTLAEAEAALETFKATLQSLTTSNIEEILDNEENTEEVTTGTTSYETREEAEKIANDLNKNTDDYEIVANVREESKTVTEGPIDVESEQFDTREEAEAYIAELQEQGYDVSNLRVELVPFEEAVWGDEDNVIVNPGTGSSSSFTYGHFDVTLLTEFTKIDANGNETTVTGKITISNVKINNSNVAMEGPSIDKNTGLTEYTSEERRDLNVTNNSLVEISGTVAYYTNEAQTTLSDSLSFTIKGYLTESQNVCGGTLGRDKGFDLEFESVTIINNKVVIDTNVVSKYKVTGTMTRTYEQPIYYVDTTKITYGYDYTVNASGIKLVGYALNGTAIKNTYRDVYLLDVNKTILDYDYHLYGEGIKFIEYLVKGTTYEDIYKDVYLLNMSKTTLDYDYKVTADGIKLIGYQAQGTASRDIYKDVYTLNMEKNILDYDYEVSGIGIKTYYDVISKYVRLTNINYLIEYMELGKGGDIEVLPPQTGVNNNVSLINIIVSLISGLILIIRRFI